jgi:hypothetical protein
MLRAARQAKRVDLLEKIYRGNESGSSEKKLIGLGDGKDGFGSGLMELGRCLYSTVWRNLDPKNFDKILY